jgi:hypothetical protein
VEDESDWIQQRLDRELPRPQAGSLCTDDDLNDLLNLSELHFNQHPYFPRVENNDAEQPTLFIPAERPEESLHPNRQLSAREDIHPGAVCELFNYCRDIENPAALRYLWVNWYRGEELNGRSLGRWELIAISQSTDVPRARTTMRAEAHC